MNKQRYLAELQRLLVFMTEEDRTLTVRRYGEIFDAAGPEGEAAVAASLGSPTKAAIALSRGYEPGTAAQRLPAAPAAPEPEPVPLTATEPDPWGDLPRFDLEDEPLLPDPEGTIPPAAPEPEPEPEPIPDPVPAAEIPAERKPVKISGAPAPRPESRQARTVVESSVPLGLGIPLFLFLALALGLPFALICLALTAVFIAPGCAVIFGAYLVFVGGLWCTAFMADAIMLFGAALIVLALGLVILWVGLWIASRFWILWGRAMSWLAGELLGRKVTVYE